MQNTTSVDELIAGLKTVGYFADRRLATAVFLALKLQRPLLLEGEPGVGKTELAKALSRWLGRPLLRLFTREVRTRHADSLSLLFRLASRQVRQPSSHVGAHPGRSPVDNSRALWTAASRGGRAVGGPTAP